MVRHISDALLVQKILQQDSSHHMWDEVQRCREAGYYDLVGEWWSCDNGTFGDDSAYLGDDQ